VYINQKLNRDIAYSIRMEPGVQTPEETLGKALGSCRDSAWLMVQVLRHLGLAARFVSGYRVQLTADIKSLDGPSDLSQILLTCMHGQKYIFRCRLGWLLILRPVYLQAKGISALAVHRIMQVPRRCRCK
jgi:transglutaminase-like putative cysteine protease